MTKEEIENIDIKVFEEKAVVMSAEDYAKIWKYIHQLQKENEKQKEILDKLIKFINVDYYVQEGVKHYFAYIITNNVNKTVDITKEQYEILKEWKQE